MSLTLPAFDLPLAVLLAVVFVAGIARGMSGFGSRHDRRPGRRCRSTARKAALAILVILEFPARHAGHYPGDADRPLARSTAGVPWGCSCSCRLASTSSRTATPRRCAGSSRSQFSLRVAVLMDRIPLSRPAQRRRYRSASAASPACLSGIASIPGPPVIFYWLASDLPAAIVRANLLDLFPDRRAWFRSATSGLAGLFKPRRASSSASSAMPVYFAGHC